MKIYYIQKLTLTLEEFISKFDIENKTMSKIKIEDIGGL